MTGLTSVIRAVTIVAVLLLLAAGAGFGAAAGSSIVTITAAAGLDITVPVVATVLSTGPGSCGTATGSTINVKSNKVWNLQVRSEPTTYANGKAKNGVTELTDAFQYKGADVASYTAITSSYVDLFTSNQAKTAGAGVDVSMDYQQCIEYADSPGVYTIVVEYLGVQP